MQLTTRIGSTDRERLHLGRHTSPNTRTSHAEPILERGKDERRACRTFGRVDTLGLDTIAGAKLLQLKFGPAGAFQPEQAVLHGDRRARFIRMSDGAAIIRHSGSNHPVAVALETLSLPPGERDDARPAGAFPSRSRPGLLAGRRFPRHPAQRRPPLRP